MLSIIDIIIIIIIVVPNSKADQLVTKNDYGFVIMNSEGTMEGVKNEVGTV